MLISNDYKFAFVHIPRTGGNSVRETLALHCGSPVIRKSNTQILQKRLSDHLDFRLKSHVAKIVQATTLKYFITTAGHPTAALMMFTLRNFSSYKKFSFVRNPYDRIVSSFLISQSDGGYEGSFGDFVSDSIRYLQPQIKFVSLQGNILVDFIGRFENLQGDFDEICEWIGLPRLQLPVLSASPEADMRDYLSPKTKQRIVDMYEADFSAFGYPTLVF